MTKKHYKSNYITLIRSLRWWLIGIVVIFALPYFAPIGIIRILIFAAYLSIFAMSWDLMSGYTGYISFGHPFLIALASYVTAILSCRAAFQPPHIILPIYITIPLGVAASVVGGILLFLPSMKVRGPFFSLISLAYMEILYRLLIVVHPEYTGGDRGLPNLPSIVAGAIPNYYLAFGLMFIIGIGLWFVTRSDVGIVLKAIHLDEDVVESSGINTYKFKMFAFILSAVVAGIGGAFYVHYLGSLGPRRALGTNFLLEIIIAAVIGGMGTITGPIFGAFFLTIILEYLRPYLFGQWRFFAYVLLALLIIIYKPKGLYGIARDTRNWFSRRSRRKAGDKVYD